MSSANPTKSLYDILGVTKQNSCTEIKKAFLKLAKVHHPDKGGNPETFKEITRASDVLTDERRRKVYDDFGVTDEQAMQHGPPGGFPGGMPGMPPGMPGGPGFSFPFEFNMNDLFGNMFGNPPVGQRGQQPQRKGKKPAPIIQNIGITLEQFYIGHHIDIKNNRQSFCATCDHSGAKVKEVCKKCNGQGAVSQIIQVGPMAMHTTGPCLDCQGRGERVLETCKPCGGTGFLNEQREIPIKIVPGTRSNEIFVFNEVCSDHPAFERPGDAHIVIGEDANDPAFKVFKRKGQQQQDLEMRVSLSLAESLVGCVIQVDRHPGYDEGLFVKVPAGSFQNDVYCLSGFGMPIVGNIGKYGDLFIVVDVVVKPVERKLFLDKGRELLVPLFGDKVRVVECPEEAAQGDLFLL